VYIRRAKRCLQHRSGPDLALTQASGSLFPELMQSASRGRTSAPRLPQTVHTNRGAISESLASSGQPSAMTAIELAAPFFRAIDQDRSQARRRSAARRR
jgi:hypothetical protein